MSDFTRRGSAHAGDDECGFCVVYGLNSTRTLSAPNAFADDNRRQPLNRLQVMFLL